MIYPASTAVVAVIPAPWLPTPVSASPLYPRVTLSGPYRGIRPGLSL
jgi:hypothetical protein